ncbi:hypothetical protein [Crossiella sp. CA198]|uniref:hypothetical protein n=1 Tax=Crossiella sp. CA198 TaxID=3455607 RepID=UPI003F8D38B1
MRDERPGNHFEGTAHNLVQVGAAHGGVHLQVNTAARPLPRPSQLPQGVANLVNQKRVLGSLAAGMSERPELDAPKLKVLLGIPGSGKTTVALHFLRHCAADFPDGQLYLNLGAGSEQPRTVGAALTEALLALGFERGALPADAGGLGAVFRSVTEGRAFQLLIDDAALATQVESLLPGRGGSVVVVTGSGNFGTLRRLGGELINIAPLEPDMARKLLAQDAGSRMTEEPAAAEALLAQCAGLPIAVTTIGGMLAADEDLSLADLVAEFGDDSGVTRMPTADGQPMAVVFDAAYRRLGDRAQRCYLAIGLHPGTADLSVGALVALTGGTEPEVLEGLRELSALRLVERVLNQRRVHRLVRAHAAQLARRLDEDGQADLALRRLLDWYLRGAVAADSEISGNRPWRRRLFPELMVDQAHPALADPREWLQAETANLRALVELADTVAEHRAVCQFAVVLWSLYEPGKHFEDPLAVNEIGLWAARRLGLAAVESLLHVQTGFAYQHRELFEQAYAAFHAGIDPARQAGDPEAEATAVEGTGLALLGQGRADEALETLRRNLELAALIDDQRRTALAKFHLAKVEQAETALTLLAEAEPVFRGLAKGELINQAKIAWWRGRRLTDAGQFAEAADSLDRARSMFAEHGQDFEQGRVLEALAELATAQQDPGSARQRYAEACAVYDRAGLVVQAERVRPLSS